MSLTGIRSASAVAAVLACAAFVQAAEPTASAKARALALENKPWQGDFDGMLERRLVRVLVPHSRTFYTNDKGRERGITAEFVRDFERYVNQKHAKRLARRPVTFAIIPTTRDALLAKLVDGLGDLAAGDLTVTEERRKTADFFVPPQQRDVAEVVVTGPKSPAVAGTDDLAGRTVHVRRSSSYFESLTALNERLKKAGKPAVKLELVPDALEDEDLMEMLNAGLVQAIVVDDFLAKMWAPVFDRIRVNAGAAVRTGGQIGWAMRKGSPGLLEALTEFNTNVIKKSSMIAVRTQQASKRIVALKDPGAREELQRFESTLALFRKYGAQYGFDPLLLAAQGFQESQLNQSLKSRVGAIGIMQVMPATGAELKVGDIAIAENNVHAGAKYMDQLIKLYFADARFDDTNRSLFAFASYNAGAGAIAKMRAEAKKRDFDANKWFNNVEVVTAERIGMETTTYVRNIYKYYVSYRLMTEAHGAAQKARGTVK
ncbi:MAG: lytic transglycosylase F [Burkholderiales bacterium]|nr:lytic transglycosylase F [Burkholderiales bacterium]